MIDVQVRVYQPQSVMNQLHQVKTVESPPNDIFYFLERGEHLLISSGEQRLVYNVYRKLKDERCSKPLKRTSELVGLDLKLVWEILKKEKVNRKNRRKTTRILENRCELSKVIGCKLDSLATNRKFQLFSQKAEEGWKRNRKVAPPVNYFR